MQSQRQQLMTGAKSSAKQKKPSRRGRISAEGRAFLRQILGSLTVRPFLSKIVGSLAALLLVCAGLIWAAYQFKWQATGFPGKTLWEWLQLLVVPAILASGAAFFTWWSARTERQIAKLRYEQDQELALDKHREDLLQSYLDHMSELLLEKGLCSSEKDAEVRKVARTRTVSTLTRLDGNRAGNVFVFLSEAELTKEPNPIISFNDANFRSVNWSRADLSEANLSRTYLSRANLSGSDLRWANLSMASLRWDNLSGAWLSRADLSGADLSGADLSNVRNLESAQLGKTILHGVKGLTPEQLTECKALGAIIDEEPTPATQSQSTATAAASPQQIITPQTSSSSSNAAAPASSQGTAP